MGRKEKIKSDSKHPKFGLIPDDWNVQTLKEVGRVGSGMTPSTDVIEYWEKGNIPWLSTGQVNDRIIVKSEGFITETAVKERSINLLPKGTILVAMIGQGQTRGRVALLQIEACVNQNFAYIIPNSKVNSEYLFFYLEHHYEIIRYEGNRGGSQGSLNSEMVRNLRVLLPPFLEQNHIVSVLKVGDRVIDLTTRLIAQMELRKKWLMRELLSGKKRLSGFNGKWNEVKLSDLFDRVTRKNIEGNKNVVTISAQRGFVRQEDFFNKVVASDITEGYFLVHRGEFCYNKSYSNGYPWGATKRLNDFDKAVVTTLYICFSVKDEVETCGDYFEQYFESGALDKGLMRIAHEGGRAHGLLNVTPNDFFDLKIFVPDFKEQIGVASVLRNADVELNLMKLRLDKLKELKKGLMQVLLTGKMRLNLNHN